MPWRGTADVGTRRDAGRYTRSAAAMPERPFDLAVDCGLISRLGD